MARAAPDGPAHAVLRRALEPDAPAPHVVAAAVVALPHVASDALLPRAVPVPVPDAVFPHVAGAVVPPHVALDAVFRHAAPVSGAAPPRVARCHVRLIAALPADLLRVVPDGLRRGAQHAAPLRVVPLALPAHAVRRGAG